MSRLPKDYPCYKPTSPSYTPPPISTSPPSSFLLTISQENHAERIPFSCVKCHYQPKYCTEDPMRGWKCRACSTLAEDADPTAIKICYIRTPDGDHDCCGVTCHSPSSFARIFADKKTK
jgi:hypothetical protein